MCCTSALQVPIDAVGMTGNCDVVALAIPSDVSLICGLCVLSVLSVNWRQHAGGVVSRVKPEPWCHGSGLILLTAEGIELWPGTRKTIAGTLPCRAVHLTPVLQRHVYVEADVGKIQ